MLKEKGFTGWLRYETENEANELIEKINECKGFPTPDGRTTTWSIPLCFQYGYSPNETDINWYVIVKEEIKDCLTQEEWDSQITSVPDGWVKCGTPEPPITGSTENI